MSRVILDQPEPRPGRVPRGGAMTSEAMARAFIERVMGKRTDDDDKPIVVPDDEPVEDEPVEDDEADTLEGGEHRPRVTLYGVSAEELARMRASQAAEEAEKQNKLRIRATWPQEDRG